MPPMDPFMIPGMEDILDTPGVEIRDSMTQSTLEGMDPRTMLLIALMGSIAHGQGGHIGLTSGHRTREANRAVGGEDTSRHQVGGAFDAQLFNTAPGGMPNKMRGPQDPMAMIMLLRALLEGSGDTRVNPSSGRAIHTSVPPRMKTRRPY